MLEIESYINGDLQQLIGHLSFLARALVAARTFLRRLIDGICGVSEQNAIIYLEGGAQKDISWWETVLLQRERFSMSLQHSELRLPHHHDLYTDSCLVACGAVFRDCWFSLRFPKCMRDISTDIAVKELAALTLAIVTWGKELAKRRLLIHCDNMAVNEVMRTGTSKNPVLMSLMRFLSLKCISLDLTVHTSYIRSVDNRAADLLSRMDLMAFRAHSPSSNLDPTPVTEFWKDVFDSCVSFHYY